MRLKSTAKVIAECKLKYYRISECEGACGCRTGRMVKMLKLPASVDEYAYMFALDYRAMVQTVRRKQQVSVHPKPSNMLAAEHSSPEKYCCQSLA